MEMLYRLLICSVPFLASFFGYYLLARRIINVDKPLPKTIAFLFLGLGLLFTVWQAVRTFAHLDDNSFNFIVIIVNVFLMAFIAIALAFAEPEQ